MTTAGEKDTSVTTGASVVGTSTVGEGVGSDVGWYVGEGVGSDVGWYVGEGVGSNDGRAVGW